MSRSPFFFMLKIVAYCSTLLLVDGALAARPHYGVLGGHTAFEGALDLGAEGELAHVLGLLLGEGDALGGESLVLHTLEALGDVADLVLGGVGGTDGGGNAVGAVAHRSARLRGKVLATAESDGGSRDGSCGPVLAGTGSLSRGGIAAQLTDGAMMGREESSEAVILSGSRRRSHEDGRDQGGICIAKNGVSPGIQTSRGGLALIGGDSSVPEK